MSYKFGTVLHYRWPDPRRHSAAMYVMPSQRGPGEIVLLPLSDADFNMDVYQRLVAKNAYAWSPCGDQCPHNPDHFSKHIGELP